MKLFRKLQRKVTSGANESEKGQGMVEYALILVLIAVVVIVTLTLLGGIIVDVFSNISTGL
jgi:pilus assembly protein Flp/PilA